MSGIIGIIPARYASTRFPAKALADIAGKSMIRRVWEQASRASSLQELVIATDHEAIYAHVSDFGGRVVMTSAHHQSGTDRCYEAYEQSGSKAEYVINIQGDEPFIDPRQIDLLAAQLQNDTELATLAIPISQQEHLFNPNVVKVVCSQQGRALYFSRAAIPHQRGVEAERWLETGGHYKHIGIYGYRSDVLAQITQLPVSPLEQAESLEQLRWLDAGYSIKVGITEQESIGIDTPEDLAEALRQRPTS